MFEIFILTTAIGISSSRSPASDTKDAYKSLVKAAYIQTGTNIKVKNLEKKYVPTKIKEYGGWIAGITKLVTEQKVSIEMTF